MQSIYNCSASMNTNKPTLDLSTYKLIRNMCIEFQLPADIEFTCYESYTVYLQRYFRDLERRVKQTTAMQFNNNCCTSNNNNIDYSTISFNDNGASEILATNDIIDNLLDEVEQTSLLHVLSLISICAKYINGHRSEKLVKKFSTYLENTGSPYTAHQIRNSEYLVFKCLAFNVSTIKVKWACKWCYYYCWKVICVDLLLLLSLLLLLWFVRAVEIQWKSSTQFQTTQSKSETEKMRRNHTSNENLINHKLITVQFDFQTD